MAEFERPDGITDLNWVLMRRGVIPHPDTFLSDDTSICHCTCHTGGIIHFTNCCVECPVCHELITVGNGETHRLYCPDTDIR